jgi:thiamine-phosphate pyrophosphorylase
VALGVGATGVHLGQDDLSPEAARKILGPKAVIGLSTHSVEQAQTANQLPVNYIAIGPVFETRSKRSEYQPLGPRGVGRVRRVVTKPLVAIGGITRGAGREVLDAGADGLAVISALLSAEDLESAAREMMKEWTSGK